MPPTNIKGAYREQGGNSFSINDLIDAIKSLPVHKNDTEAKANGVGLKEPYILSSQFDPQGNNTYGMKGGTIVVRTEP